MVSNENDLVSDGNFPYPPRYRSVEISEILPLIIAVGRCGMNIRVDYEDEINECETHPDFIYSSEEDHDRTYMYFIYCIPPEKYEIWKKDHRKNIDIEMINSSREIMELQHDFPSYPKDHEVHMLCEIIYGT